VNSMDEKFNISSTEIPTKWDDEEEEVVIDE
jgi:hypothetical protein